MNAFNCSDGVKIEGARPLLPKACNINSLSLEKESIVDSITAELPLLRAKEFFKTHEMTKHLSELIELRRDYMDFMDNILLNYNDFEPFYKDLIDFLEEKDRAYSGIQRLMAGSVSAIPKVALFYVNRLEKEQDRLDALKAFFKEFLRIIEEMFDKTLQLFLKIAEKDLNLEIGPHLREWK